MMSQSNPENIMLNPEVKEHTNECKIILNMLLHQHGFLNTMVCLATLVSELPPHTARNYDDWESVSMSLNKLVNKMLEHNQKTKVTKGFYPFGV